MALLRSGTPARPRRSSIASTTGAPASALVSSSAPAAPLHACSPAPVRSRRVRAPSCAPSRNCFCPLAIVVCNAPDGAPLPQRYLALEYPEHDLAASRRRLLNGLRLTPHLRLGDTTWMCPRNSDPRQNNNTYFFNGWLDEVAIYPTALSGTTIQPITAPRTPCRSGSRQCLGSRRYGLGSG